MLRQSTGGVLSITLLVFCSFQMVRGQQKIGHTFGSGINVVGVDSSFHLKFGLRVQTLYEGFYNIENGNYTDNLQIRRFRLKFDGFALSPRFVYKIELGQSNRDVVGDSQLSGSAAKILLDAVMKFNAHNNIWIWFGQTKLPGNRERVISSQNQEFVDRSLVNTWFNLDRDLGLQVHNEHAIGKGVFRERASISMGEGRNVTAPNIGGYDYTLRLEYLPLGKFTLNTLQRPPPMPPRERRAHDARYDHQTKRKQARSSLGDLEQQPQFQDRNQGHQ